MKTLKLFPILLSLLACDAGDGALGGGLADDSLLSDDSADIVLADSVPPNPALVRAYYNIDLHALSFEWTWRGDRSCDDCELPVGRCTSDGVSDGPTQIPCDPAHDAPFWMQLVNHTTGEVMSAAYRAQFDSGYVPCGGLEGQTLRVDVDVRDAHGNIQNSGDFPGGRWSNVRTAYLACPTQDRVPPDQPRLYSRYLPEEHALRFSWSWTGDENCYDCGRAAGMCRENGTNDLGDTCNAWSRAPFKWALVDQDGKLLRDASGNVVGFSGTNVLHRISDEITLWPWNTPSSHATAVDVPCAGREGQIVGARLYVRDAAGNETEWPEIRMDRCPEVGQ